MTLLSPIALEIVGYAAAALAGLTALAYVLKMRRRRFEVPFSTLWQRVLQERESTSLWKHLKRLLSLLFMLLILGLLLFSTTEPRLGKADDDAKNVVIIIDTSASMKTRDAGRKGDRARIDVAREKASDLLAAMGGGDSAMIMRMDGQTTPLSRFESDAPKLKKVLEGLQATDTPADLRRALSAAADALRERQNPMVVLVGDGAYPESVLNAVTFEPPAGAGKANKSEKRLDLIDLSGIDVRYIPVGKRSDNAGIVAFNVRRYIANKMSYEVFIEVENFGQKAVKRKLVLASGGDPVDVEELEIPPRKRVRRIYPNLSGGDGAVLTASLELTGQKDGGGQADRAAAHDVFPLDDTAYALLPERKAQKVLLVTKDNLYLEGAMLVYDNIHVDKLLPEEYQAAAAKGDLGDYDAVVFDDFTPEKLPPPGTNLLYFHPQGEHSPFQIHGKLERPHVTEINENHPVMRWLVLNDTNFDKTEVFRIDRDKREVALAKSIRSPMIAAKREDGRKIVACGFSLTGTDLMLRVAFPLFLVNTLDWFAGDDADLITTYTTGHRVRVPMDGTFGVDHVEVLTPSRKKKQAPLVDGKAVFYASEIGVHSLSARLDGQVVSHIDLAANLSDPEESDIAPSGELNMGGKPIEKPEGFAVTHRQSLWLYLALLALFLLGVEWLTYNRRITV